MNTLKKIPLRPLMFIFFVVAVLVLVRLTGLGEHLTFERIQRERFIFREYVNRQYPGAVLTYIALFIGTAFVLPGALALIIAGGFLFGALPAVLYANLGMLTGASLAFVSSRHALGKWVQSKYGAPLKKFNEEIRRNGQRYIIFLRIQPVFPFFLVNYFAGITKISFKTFFWTTVVGMVPGSFVYAFAGQQLGNIRSKNDLYSPGVVFPLVAMLVLYLIPLVLTYKKARKPAR